MEKTIILCFHICESQLTTLDLTQLLVCPTGGFVMAAVTLRLREEMIFSNLARNAILFCSLQSLIKLRSVKYCATQKFIVFGEILKLLSLFK